MVLQICVGLGKMLASKETLHVKAMVSNFVKTFTQQFGFWSARQQHASTYPIG